MYNSTERPTCTESSSGTSRGLKRRLRSSTIALCVLLCVGCKGKELISPTAPPDLFNFSTTKLVMHSPCTFAVDVFATNHEGFATQPVRIEAGQTATMDVVQIGAVHEVDLIVARVGSSVSASMHLSTGGYPTTGLTLDLPCPR